MMNNYNYQLSRSYCKSVTPPSGEEVDTENDRPNSPDPSEVSDHPTEAASFTSKRSASHRRSSTQSRNSIDHGKKIPPRQRLRKTSLYPVGLAAIVSSKSTN